MGLLEDLSAAFVAFTIEVDDAAEAAIKRRTTKGPWLVSLAMWRNCMQWVPAEGVTVGELVAIARTPTDFGGMNRWGYVEIEGMARSASGRPRAEAAVRPTRRGALAQRIWDGLPEEVEGRWAERFGGGEVRELRQALMGLVGGLDRGLPDTMPIVRHGWGTRRDEEPERRPGPIAVVDLGLDSLLARSLTAFALEYEASGKLSLAIGANLLAVLGPEPTPLRDLPAATGIHRAQIDNAVGYLERAALVEVAPSAGGGTSAAAGGTAAPSARTRRGRSVALTAGGAKAKSGSARKLAKLEATWAERHGASLARVHEALAPLAAGGGPDSPLPAGLEHPPGTWRAESKPLARLPRFPLVTHRGGFPDGA